MNTEVVEWRMVGQRMVFRVEARLPGESWRKICVRKSSKRPSIRTFGGFASGDTLAETFSEFNFARCVGSDTVPNDTSINDVIVGELRPRIQVGQNEIHLLRLQNATDCSEVTLINLNVDCIGYGK